MRVLRAAALLVVVGCSDPAATSTDYYQDALASRDCAEVPTKATVKVASSGLRSGTKFSTPIAPPAEGELVMVAIAKDETSQFSGHVSVAEGTETLQIAMSSEPCGRSAVSWALFDVLPPTTSLDVSSDTPGAFAVFVARFTGLEIAQDAHKGRYAWSRSAAGADVDACPGTAIVTTTVSCSDLALRPDSPFTLIDSVQGMAAAAYVPSEPGRYGAAWTTDGESSSMTIALP